MHELITFCRWWCLWRWSRSNATVPPAPSHLRVAGPRARTLPQCTPPALPGVQIGRRSCLHYPCKHNHKVLSQTTTFETGKTFYSCLSLINIQRNMKLLITKPAMNSFLKIIFIENEVSAYKTTFSSKSSYKTDAPYLRRILFLALFSSLKTLEVLRSPSRMIQPLWIVPPSCLSDVFTSMSYSGTKRGYS